MARIVELSPSMFAACRCTIALAYADGVFDANERKVVNSYFKLLGFSDEQRAILTKDSQGGYIDFDAEFAKITDLRARAYFINLARVLTYADGTFSVEEHALLKRVLGDHLDTIDFGTKEQPQPFRVESSYNDCKVSRPKSTQNISPHTKQPTTIPTFKEVPLIQPNEIQNMRNIQSTNKNTLHPTNKRLHDNIGLSPETQKLREFSMGHRHGLLNYLKRILG